MLVLAFATTLIVAWTAWLVHARRVPRWLPAIGWSAVISTIATCILTWRALQHAFTRVSAAEASNKASLLAHSISSALDWLVAGGAVVLAAALVLGYFTIRAPRRDHL